MKIDSSAPKRKLSSLIERPQRVPSRKRSLEKGDIEFLRMKHQELFHRSLERLLKVRFPRRSAALQSLVRELSLLAGRLPVTASGKPENTEESRLLMKILKSVMTRDLPDKALKELRVLEGFLEQERGTPSVLLYPPERDAGRREIRIEEDRGESGEDREDPPVLRMLLDCEHLGRVSVVLKGGRRTIEPSGSGSSGISCRIGISERSALTLIKKNRQRLTKRLLERKLMPDLLKLFFEPEGRGERDKTQSEDGEGVELWG